MNLALVPPAGEPIIGELRRLTRASQVIQHALATELLNVDDTAQTRDIVSRVCMRGQIDFAFLRPSAKLSDYKLLVFDMDSTLINIECVDEIADFVGRKSEVSAITEATMRGEIENFEDSLRARVTALSGADFDVLRQVFETRLQLATGAEALILSAKRLGMRVGLLSGGFSYFAERLRTLLELDFAYANELELKHGALTGKVVGRIVDGRTKAELVFDQMTQYEVSSDELIVVGDGANDIPMMQLSSFAVAYHAKQAVQRIATHSINFGGMDTIIAWLRMPS